MTKALRLTGKVCLYLSLLLATFYNVQATHIMGVDITYECVGPCTYRVHWRAYRDCGGVTGISPNINFNVVSGSNCPQPSPFGNWTAQQTQEVTPICPGITTRCTDPNASINGVQEYYRYRDYNICTPGCVYQISWYDCCRNNAITSGAASDGIFTGATTINTGIQPCNSSPQFSNPPIPYICAGQSFTFNQGAYDLDGDSLVYSLGPCYDNNNTNQVGYNAGAGYSPTSPLGNSWTVNVDPQTGDVSVIPTPGNQVVGVLCIYVEEYRNGQLIGTVVRDMQITVINCGPNTAPSTNGATNVSGGSANGFVVNTCLGSNLCFDIPVTDPDAGQTVTFWWNQNIPGATFTQTNGNQTDTLTGANPSATFCWTPTTAGTFTFLVSMQDDNCPLLASNQYTFQIIVSPGFTVTANTQVNCQTASLSAQVSGGTAPYTYAWSGSGGLNATGWSVNHSYPAPGNYNYTVTVTDANGCTGTFSGTLSIPQGLNLSAQSSDVSCNGGSNGSGSISVSNGTAPYTYAWSNGGSSSSISNLSAGTYSVIVTDANGCQAYDTLQIAEPSPLSATINTVSPTCNGGVNGTASSTITGGTAPYSYAWSNGQTTPNASGLSAGNGSLIITDANGCVLSQNFALTQPSPLSVTFATQNASCAGGNDGGATASVSGGNGPYTYTWSNNQTGAQLSSVPAGSYTLNVIDANGCTATAAVNIGQASPIQLTLSTQDPDCFGGNNGSAAVQVSGGNAPYNYAWSSGQTGATASGLSAGSHSLQVTDANGCTSTATFNLNAPSALTLSLSTQDVSCANGSNGGASATVSGGTPPYSYAWSNGASASSISGLSAGSYTLQVIDANGCAANQAVSIQEPQAIQLTLSAQDVNCYGGSDGAVSSTVTGGTPPYSYSWSNGGSSPSLSNQSAGNLSLVVTDGNGCSASASAQINQPAALVLSFNSQAARCNGSADGSAQVTVSGGTPPYSYSWSNGQTQAQSTNLSAGNWSVSITDANGCTQNGQVSISEPDPIQIASQAKAVSCAGESDGGIGLAISGGTPPYSVSWNNGQTGTNLTGIPAGIYQATVTDANACTQNVSVTVTEPEELQVQIRGNRQICLGSTGQLEAQVAGGTAPYTYSWTSNPTGFQSSSYQASVNPSANTQYTLQVIDANGCTQSSTWQMEVLPLPEADFEVSETEACDTLTVSFVNLSTGAVAWHWDFGDGSSSTDQHPVHTFGVGTFDVSLIAMTADGCTDTLTRKGLIRILPTPVAAFTTRESLGDPILLEDAMIHFQNRSLHANRYFWEFGDGAVSSEIHPIHRYGEPGTYPVTLYAYNAYGCYDSVTISPILIIPNGVIYVPNAFSPNGDGTNEEFLLKGEGITDYELIIYNRWGSEVFRSRSINNSWDGQYKGQPAQEGVYVWKLHVRLNNGTETQRGGTCTLIR